MSDDFVKQEFSPEEEKFENDQDALLSEMGITRQDDAKLRSAMLSADEAVHAKKEQLDNARARKGRKSDWDEFVDAKRRMGRVMPANEFIRLLRPLIPSLNIVDGRIAHQLSLNRYTHKAFVDHWGTQHVKWGWENIGWIHDDWMPEYEIDFTNDVQIAIGRRHGWRSVLLNLILHKKDETNPKSLPDPIITEEQALAQFGPPTNGSTASEWRRVLYERRNGIAPHNKDKWF